MTYPIGTFKSAFWENDFLSHTGFTTLSNHMKEGQKATKLLEDYFKQRSKVEDDYSKSLLKISKNFPIDYGTFGIFLNELRRELEIEASLHAAVATKIQEETTKLADFREKQKEERKKSEEIVQKSHKNKADMYRSMLNSKKDCESRVKTAEKAESESENPKPGAKPKDIEKAKKNLWQARNIAEKSNENYKAAIHTLETARQNWELEHAVVCDQLQQMELDRIRSLRNSVWVFSNFVSDLCCQLDDSRENIRIYAEKCNEDDDVRNFTLNKTTCTKPLQPVEYIPIGWFAGDKSSHSSFKSNGSKIVETRKRTPHSDDEWDDEPDDTETFIALYDYAPQSNDEMKMKKGDSLRVIASAEKGWVKAENLTSHHSGLVPMNYLKTDKAK